MLNLSSRLSKLFYSFAIFQHCKSWASSDTCFINNLQNLIDLESNSLNKLHLSQWQQYAVQQAQKLCIFKVCNILDIFIMFITSIVYQEPTIIKCTMKSSIFIIFKYSSLWQLFTQSRLLKNYPNCCGFFCGFYVNMLNIKRHIAWMKWCLNINNIILLL